MLFIAAAYIIGAIIAAGVTGGVRDEMDGLADLAIIFFWPLALIVWVIVKVCKALLWIGRQFGKQR